ncbi:MAG: PAS domain-containing protein [Firmicutes bacterium]|nr:PAS domain-containing protein [Bacillota bacterium]
MLEEESERLHHRKAIGELVKQLIPVFENSTEGVFVYLDDDHKACNELLADMFGYTPLQWEEFSPFSHLFSKESRDDIMATYYEKIIAERAPAELPITGIRKDGSSFRARLLMVPISFNGVLFALGFVKPTGA